MIFLSDMKIPNQLKFTKDDNIIEFVETIEREGGKKLPEPNYVYKYIVSKNKFGFLLVLTQDQIDDLLRNDIAIVNIC